MNGPSVDIKSQLEDWRVHEIGAKALSGSGEHAYFYVEKSALNSMDVARLLAQSYGCAPGEVGFAGRKDKYGITRQWFSVPTVMDEWCLEHPQVSCLEIARHSNKLRRGELRGNQFRLVLRQVVGLNGDDLLTLEGGFANFFGPQRVSKDNVEQASEWLLNRRRRRLARVQQGWYLSVVRSHLFNTILSHRMAQGVPSDTWVEGDTTIDSRPAGPMWGRGRSSARDRALALQEAALAPFGAVCEALEFAGVAQGLRVFHVKPDGLKVDQQADTIELCCSLPAGAYATVMLAALGMVHDVSAPA